LAAIPDDEIASMRSVLERLVARWSALRRGSTMELGFMVAG